MELLGPVGSGKDRNGRDKNRWERKNKLGGNLEYVTAAMIGGRGKDRGGGTSVEHDRTVDS